VARRIRPDQLSLATDCEGWSIRDVMNHSVGVTLKFARSAPGTTARPTTPPGDVIGSDHAGAFHRCLDAARSAWGDANRTRVCELPFGRFPADLAAGINLFDVLAHTWDMAGPAEVPFETSAPVWAVGLEAAHAVIGPRRDPVHYREEITVGPGASTKERFLAFLGRAST
jgi:uncharacterized protein (TIGR03086 family)